MIRKPVEKIESVLRMIGETAAEDQEVDVAAT